MTSPTVTELPRTLEPLSSDTFIVGLGGEAVVQQAGANAATATPAGRSRRLTLGARIAAIVSAVR